LFVVGGVDDHSEKLDELVEDGVFLFLLELLEDLVGE
jgi:hypothetical protein